MRERRHDGRDSSGRLLTDQQATGLESNHHHRLQVVRTARPGTRDRRISKATSVVRPDERGNLNRLSRPDDQTTWAFPRPSHPSAVYLCSLRRPSFISLFRPVTTVELAHLTTRRYSISHYLVCLKPRTRAGAFFAPGRRWPPPPLYAPGWAIHSCLHLSHTAHGARHCAGWRRATTAKEPW